MKSTREPFDDELRERLLNYTEGPNKDLWQGIAPHIISLNPEPAWVVWSTRLSIIIMFSGILLFYGDKEGFSEKRRVNQITSNASDIASGGMSVPHQPDDKVTKGDRPKESENRIEGLAFAASVQYELTRLPVEALKEQENSSLVMNSAPPLSISESVGVIPRLSPADTIKSIQSSGNTLLLARDSTEKKNTNRSKRNQKRQKLFSLYFTAMPTFGYQRIKSNNHDNILIESIKRVPAFSGDRLGVRIEVGAEAPLSKRWKAFGGVLYCQRKQAIEYTETQIDSITIGNSADANVIIEPQLSSLEKSIDHELKNIGLQAGLTYQLWMKDRRVTAKEALSSRSLPIRKRKFSHVIGTGIEFHKALRENRSFKTAKGFSDPSTYVFFNLYYRMQYPNVGKLRAIFQPTFNYSFYINENLNAPFYVKPYGLGLNFGCTYNFR